MLKLAGIHHPMLSVFPAAHVAGTRPHVAFNVRLVAFIPILRLPTILSLPPILMIVSMPISWWQFLKIPVAPIWLRPLRHKPAFGTLGVVEACGWRRGSLASHTWNWNGLAALDRGDSRGFGRRVLGHCQADVLKHVLALAQRVPASNEVLRRARLWM